MRQLFVSTITLCLIAQTNLLACPSESGHKFFPENNLYFPANAKEIPKFSKVAFAETLKKIETLFAEDVKREGATLKIYADWEAPQVNAYASRTIVNEYSVHIMGGLARHPLMTLDAIALITCHEIGHHLGGFPRIFDSEWGAAEGQADYWASNKCLKKLFRNDNNLLLNKKVIVDNEVKTQCSNLYLDDQDIQLCIRNSLTGGVLSLVLNSLRPDALPLNYATPDMNITATTDDGHPDAQCRLDTYFAGALCGLDFRNPVGGKFNDVETGVCTSRQGHTYKTTRPLCWFNPKDYVKAY